VRAGIVGRAAAVWTQGEAEQGKGWNPTRQGEAAGSPSLKGSFHQPRSKAWESDAILSDGPEGAVHARPCGARWPAKR